MKNPDCIIYGLGYIGLPTAVFLASKGLKVYGVDVDLEYLKNINSGNIQTTEIGLSDMLLTSLKNKNFEAGTEYISSNIHIIVVPTPFKQNNEPDTSIVESVALKLVSNIKEGDLVILESTSPVGTTEKVAEIIYNKRKELKNKLYFAYCPERVLPGQIFSELKNNDRVIGGINPNSSKKAESFYQKFVDGDLHLTDCKTAEMCKLVENASRDVQIAFANELSIICHKANIDVWDLIELANKHPRVNILSPGSGVGGHCIAVDPYFIASQFPLESKIIGQAREINNYKSFWCYERIQENVNSLIKLKNKNIKIGIFGLTFKPDIDDVRQSPSLDIAKKVFDTYRSNVLIVEPNLTKIDDFELSDLHHAYNTCDIAIFLVNHSIFKEININPNKKKVLDFCGILK